jgi:hypothetical protein
LVSDRYQVYSVGGSRRRYPIKNKTKSEPLAHHRASRATGAFRVLLLPPVLLDYYVDEAAETMCRASTDVLSKVNGDCPIGVGYDNVVAENWLERALHYYALVED